ncbi:unnamed protein product, partial [Effrenium voratum]
MRVRVRAGPDAALMDLAILCRIPTLSELDLKAAAWVEARGYHAPTGPADYANIVRRVAFDLPDAAVVDSLERLRMRAEYDHRVTLPIKFVPVDLKSFFSGKRNWAITFQYYRRTGPHYRNKPNEREWIHVGRGTVLP